MKLLQFTYSDRPESLRVGYLVDGNKVVDLHNIDRTLPTTLIDIMRLGCPKSCNLYKLGRTTNPPTVPLSSVALRAPITGMDKVLCVGLNYKDFCDEQKLMLPPVPMMFSKFSSAVVGASQPVLLRTDVTSKVDWEVELALVISRKACNVLAADAYSYVLGYTIAQDISARDWQREKNSGQFILGKSMDTFCPIGPWITTYDEIGDPHTLDITCSVNGVQKQNSNTKNLVHQIPTVIERVTSVMTLLPGDLILTGTPGGVGSSRNPPEYLKPGDVITSYIEKLGEFTVRVEKFTKCEM